MGPKRDVVGELEEATRQHGLHFGVSSHRAEHWWWYDGGTKFDSDVRDPRYAGIYGPAQPMALPGDDDSKEPEDVYKRQAHTRPWQRARSRAGNQRAITPAMFGYAPAAPNPKKNRDAHNCQNPRDHEASKLKQDHQVTMRVISPRCPRRSPTAPDGTSKIPLAST